MPKENKMNETMDINVDKNESTIFELMPELMTTTAPNDTLPADGLNETCSLITALKMQKSDSQEFKMKYLDYNKSESFVEHQPIVSCDLEGYALFQFGNGDTYEGEYQDSKKMEREYIQLLRALNM